MGAANVLVELLIIIKYSDGEFKDPAPGYIIWSWIVGISVLVCYAIWTYGGGLREWIGTWSGGSNDVENKEMTTGRGKRNTRQKQSTSSSSSCSSSVLTSSRVAALVSEEDFQTLHHHLDSESPTTRILRKRQKA